ncbi:hypothetical protein OS493_035615 [Desmophyllum pertusum]|uniref:Uncharacterized protein n=1 Tax=Desmophyllum pertusum TaxID=174260 RepID=A0A9W9ZIF7_9CNID|nr:hypothetical protein OS493_035615 [Desmophyllum pertusum]
MGVETRIPDESAQGAEYPNYDELGSEWQGLDRVFVHRELFDEMATDNSSRTTVVYALYNHVSEHFPANLMDKQRDGGTWSNTGCHMVTENDLNVECGCDHLTNFAILMQIKEFEIPEEHLKALTVITYVGCGISLFGLALTLATFLSLETLASERTSIHKNLVVAIGLAQIVFLAGIDATYNPIACKAVALFLHYLYTAAFTWMLCEGIHLYSKVVEVFSEGSKMKYYYALGWGLVSRVCLSCYRCFGLTWVFGLMAINKETIVFQYLFAILNSLQGLFIFAFHCVGNTEVRVAYKRLHEKRTLAKSLPEHSLSSSHHSSREKRRMDSHETYLTGDDDIIVTKTIRSVSDVKISGDNMAMQTFGDADSGRWSLNCPSPDPFFDLEHAKRA